MNEINDEYLMASFSHIIGFEKLRKKLSSTKVMKYVSYIDYNKLEFDDAHVLGVVMALKMFPTVKQVYKRINSKSKQYNDVKYAHLYDDYNLVYFYVIGKSVKSYHDALIFNGSSVDKKNQLIEFVNIVNQGYCCWKRIVVALLLHGCTMEVMEVLERMGVMVCTPYVYEYCDEYAEGNVIADYSNGKFWNLDYLHIREEVVIFIDITTVFALISDITNQENSNKSYITEMLRIQQSVQQLQNTRDHIIENINQYKWITCRTAFESMKLICSTVGGMYERERFERFKSLLEIVEDSPDEIIMGLKENKTISQRSKIIFGTCFRLNIRISTSNTGFINHCSNTGITIPCFLHDAIALAEEKSF